MRTYSDALAPDKGAFLVGNIVPCRFMVSRAVGQSFGMGVEAGAFGESLRGIGCGEGGSICAHRFLFLWLYGL